MKPKPNPKRKPYVPPRVVSDRIYERYGLACGKQSGSPIPNCMSGPMVS